MQIATLITHEIKSNTYVCYNENKTTCFIIDPAGDSNAVINFLEDNGLKPNYILLTHTHLDHIDIVDEISEKYSPQLWVHHLDEAGLTDPTHNLTSNFAMNKLILKTKATKLLNDGDVLSVGDFKVKVLHTPGHSPGGVCFYFEDEGVLFSGDSLFRLNIGRCDFHYSSFEDLISSLLEKVLILPDDTEVFCGHGPQTNIATEKRRNPYFR